MRHFKFLLFIMLLLCSSVYAQDSLRVTMYYAKLNSKTADGTIVKNPSTQRICAVSPDLLKKYPYGTKLLIDGVTYTVHDRTAKRIKRTVDILIPRNKKAVTHYKKVNKI